MRAFASKQTPAEETKSTGFTNSGRQVSPQLTASSRLQRTCACGGGCPNCLDRNDSSYAIQKKSLEISNPADADEREADDIARRVVDGQPATIRETGAAVNRSDAGPAEASAEFHSTLESSKTGGRSLDSSTRSEMESKMGVDLSGVRIHTGGAAHKMNEDVSAKAFTYGQDIFFRQGEFDTGSRQGKELLAHELVHTRQQDGRSLVHRQQSGDWQIDPSSYSFKTQVEANARLKELQGKGEWENYRVVSFTSKGAGELWRVEIKGRKKVSTPTAKTPENAWQKDNAEKDADLYFDTEKEAIERRNKLLKSQDPAKEFRIVSFTLSDKVTVRWKVEARDKVKASPAVKEGAKDVKKEGPATAGEARKPESSTGVFTVGGDPKGDKIMRVAWTIDDGPSGTNTEKMRGITKENTGVQGLKNVTWYVQRNKLKTDNDYKLVKDRQDEGGEIAIHSFSPEEDHSTWFPISAKAVTFTSQTDPTKTSKPYGTPYEGKTEGDIIKDLTTFKEDLEKRLFRVRFVRLPGGLISELFAYAKTLELTGEKKDIEPILMSILQGKDYPKNAFDFGLEQKPEPDKKAGTKAEQEQKAKAEEKRKQEIRDGRKTAANLIKKDFQILKAGLNALNLIEWSGSDDPNILERQSWQSETSGVAGRNDNTTKVVSEARKDPKKKDNNLAEANAGKGVFEKKIAGMKPGEARSLVILAHDSSAEDANAVKADMDEMERVAKAEHIKIEYHTMSSLFQNVTKQDLKTFKVQYK